MGEQWPDPHVGAAAPAPGGHRPPEPPREPAHNDRAQPRFAPPQDTDPFQPDAPGRAPGAVFTAAGADAPPPASPGTPKGPPSEPPARVGSAVASLIVAILTLLVPAMLWLLGIPVLSLLVNIPGIVLASIALAKSNDPPELERFMRYAWACTIVYIGLMVVIVAAVLLLISALLPF